MSGKTRALRWPKRLLSRAQAVEAQPRFEGHVEELEPRILFSADPLTALVTPEAMATTADIPSSVQYVMPPVAADQQQSAPPPSAQSPTASTGAQGATAAARPTEIVFVDANVPDAQQLISQILAQQTGQHTLEIHWLDAGHDGVDQITQVLQGRQDIAALHLISHGQDGALQLGNAWLDQHTLATHMGQLVSWQAALSQDADILIYGCDVAATAQGQHFVDDLALLTGADVAASDNKTGSASLGGDWKLEYQAGFVDKQLYASASAVPQWNHELATLTLREGLNGYTGTTDTYLHTTTGIADNTSFATATTLLAGEDGTGGQAQVLLRFDNLAGTGTNQIPTGSTITSVTLTMQITTQSTFTNPSFDFHRMLVSWQDTSTWDSMSGGVSTPFDASSTVDGTITENGTGTYTIASNANMVATVQSWINNPSSNYGWWTDNGNYSSRIAFASSENGTASYRPTLAITYTPPTPPSIDLDLNNSSGATGSNYSGAFIENGAAVKVADTDATITAGSSSNLSSMTVVLGATPDGTAESLAATTTGTNITASYVAATRTLTLSGTDTVANYQSVLRSITYNNTSDTPNTTARTLTVTVTDPYGQTVSGTSTLSVTATNDAPTITSNGGGTSASVSVKETLTAVTTVTATDPDSGTLTYSISGGADAAKFSIVASTGVLTFTSAPDFENPTDVGANNVYDVIVQVSDGSLTDTQAIAVTVTDVSSALVVTTTADTNDTGLGTGFTAEQLNVIMGGTDTKVSLREAIIAANNTVGVDTITFNIATGTAGTGSDAGAYVITTASALPTITEAVTINASTQSGYVVGGLHTVVLDGNAGSSDGLYLSNTADGSTIRGLVIRNFSANGIYVQAASDNNVIVGNYIGSFNADGSNAGSGKRNASEGIESYGHTLTIGGTTAADRNVISGNASAYNIYLGNGAGASVISGNYIGTNAAGNAVFNTNSAYGIMVEDPVNNVTIGGTASGAGNVISGFTSSGVWLTTGGTNTVQGNYIGTDATGSVDLGNTQYGIYVDDGGSVVIGGTAAGAGNVVSGNNGGGIYLANSGTATVQGNIIGLNAAGTAALGNTGTGIYVNTGGVTTIGGNTASARNVVSGNSGYGIDIESSPTGGHVVKGNYIGVGANGTTLLGNGLAGIYINANNANIGGKTAGDGNIIAGNGGAGIAVAGGTGNFFYRNSIYSNTGLGIDLANDGVTANDLNDGDGGPNWRNNFPVITSVVTNGTSTTIQGSVDWYHNAGQTIYIELFSSPSVDATGYGEGKTYLGSVAVTSNSLGDATFSLTVAGVSVGDWITAVANYETAAFGASEFSKAVQAVAPANAPRGRLIWNGNDQFFQGYADWSTAGFSDVGTNGIAYGDDISMIAAWEAPTRNEILFIGSADVSGKILAGIWNGTSWSSVISMPVADPGATASKYDSFAVAYDQVSGDAMLVWDNGGTGTGGLSYATWNGTSWSSINTITAPVSGEPQHMKLVSNPRGHDMVLAVQNASASNNQYAMVWNGSSWGNAQTLGTNTNDQYFELNVAYEQQSGRAMVVYDNSASNSSNVQYRIWSGSSWGSEGTITAAAGVTATSDLYSTAIASDPTSNRIAIAAKDAANEVWLSVWNGSSWGSSLLATSSGVALTDDHPTMAVAFESLSGDLLAVYGKSAGPNIYYRTWTSGGGWSAEGTGPSMGGTDIPYVAKLYADPYSNTIMLGVQDNADALNMAAWDGSAWGGVTQIDSNTGFSYRENFTYVWFQNAAVVANVAGDTLAYTEDQSAQVIDQGTAATVTMSDETLYNGGNLTVSFTAGSTSAEDVLAIRNQGTGAGQIGLSGGNVTYAGTTIGTYTGGTGGSNLVITFNGNATNAAVTALIKNITYQNTNTGAPSTSNRTVRFMVTNSLGQASTSSDVTVTVTAVNDAPTNTVPGAQSTNEDTPLVFSSGNGNLISVADVDASGSNLQVTLTVTNGSLTLSGTSGLSFTAGDGTADGTMTFTGTASAINTALAGMTYTPTGNYNGAAQLTITTSDLGNTGSGGVQTDTDNVAITVNAVNDAPVNSVPGAQSVNEDGTLTFSSGNGNLVSISDVDAASGSMQVTLTVTNGTLTLSGTTGLSFTAGDGTADSTMTFTGTVSAINTALAGMAFSPTANYNGAAQLTITTSDQGNTGSGGAKTDTDNVAITVNAVNDAPVNSVPGAQSINEDATLTFSSGNGNLISVSDVDAASGSLQVTISVAHGSLTLSGTTGLSFTAGDGTADSTMTFTGTASAINTALAGLSYTPTGNYNGSDLLTITTSDQGNTGSGGAQTDTDNVAITVNAVNDAPVNSVPGAQSVNEDGTLTFSSGNGNLVSVSDVDAASGSMQATLTVTNGTLTLSGTTGLSFTAGDGTADSTMTFTGTVSAINTALAGMAFSPTANYNGAAQLTITTSDQGNTGSGGAKTDTDNVAITVNAVNDAPVNSVPGAQSINEDATLTFSSGNGNLISISDVDAGSSNMKLTLNVSSGALTLSRITGLTFTTGDGTADGTMVFTGTRTNINAALAGMVYTPAIDANGAVTLTITSDDQGNTGSGGTKTDVDLVTINVNAINDAPVATIAPVSYSATEQTAMALHGTGLSISDVDAGSSTIQATLTVASGTLNVAAGTTGVVVTGSATGTVTLSGTLTQINNLLAGNGGATLTYTVNSDAPPASDLLTMTVSDLGNSGSGGTLTGADTATINIISVNDAPTATITEPGYSVVEAQNLALHNTGLSVADPDGTSTTVQVTLSASLGALTVTAGTTGVTIGGSGTGSVTLSGTVSQINNLLAGNGGATVSYINNSGTPTASATLTLAVDDLGNTGGGNLTASANVTISVIPAASMGAVGVPGVQPSDIKAYYGFDASGSLGRDDSAGGHNITLIGTPTQDTGIDGRNSAIALVNDDTGGGTLTGGSIAGLSTGGAMTISLWVRFDAFNNASGGGDRVIDFGQAGAAGIGNIVISRSGVTQQMSFSLQHSGVVQDTVTTAVGDTVQLGQWAHIVATVDAGGAMKIYFNGTLSGTLQGTALSTGVRTNNYVGQSNAAGTYGMNGAIDNLLLVNRAMSGSEVAMLYDQSAGFNVNEKAANGTAVGTVVDGSSVSGRTVSYTLVNSAGGRFAIDATSGLLTVADSANLLHADASSHTITVRATDNFGNSQDTSYTVNLLNINDAPVGTDHTVSANEDTVYTFGTADFGFTDPGDTSPNALLAVKITTLPASGTLTLNGAAVSANDVVSAADIIAGKLQFTAASDAHGTGYASFGFRVQDDGGTANGGVDEDTTTRTMTIDVASVNDAPTGTNHTATTLEDTPYVFATADFGFSDTDGNTLQAVKITGLPVAGTLTLNGVAVSLNDVVSASDIASGLLAFTPDANANGAGYASFTFKVQDNGDTANGGANLDAADRTMTMSVTAVNDAPAGTDHTVSTNEDTAYTLTAADFGFTDASDSPGHTLSAVKLSVLPGAGTLTLNGNTVSVGDVVTVADINAGLLVFTPVANANGAGYAALGFQVIDNGGTANGGVNMDATIRTLTIDVNAVNDAPTANNPGVSGNEDTAINGSVTGSDVEGDTLSYSKASNPAHGSVNVASDGSFSYTPAANFNGSDSFTVLVSDGHGGTVTSTVTITVNAVNDAPTANNPSVSGNEDTVITGAVTGADVDGDTLGYAKATDPTHGSVNVASDGSFSYTPSGNYNGADSFTVTVSDGHGGTTTSTVTVTVNAVNDAPTATPVSASGNEDNAINGQVVGADVDGDTLSYAKASDPTHGNVVVAADGNFSYTPLADFHGSDSFTVTVSDGHGGTATCTVSIAVASVNDAPAADNPSVHGNEDSAILGAITANDVDGDALAFTKSSDPTHGSVTLNSDGSFSYTPTANFNGNDSFTVTVSDGHGGSVLSTVTLHVAPVNDAPVANNPGVLGAEDQSIGGNVTATDVEGDTLTYQVSADPAHGSVSVDSSGAFLYTPTANFHGADTFTILVSDGQGGSALSTVSVVVTSVNDAPTVNSPSVSGTEDTALIGQVTGGDVDGDSLGYAKGSDPAHGSVTVRSDGSFTYTPTANFNGSDSFTVVVSDGQGGTATSTVSVTIGAVNDAPTTNNPAVSGAEDTVITGSVTGNDVDGDALHYVQGSAPAHGNVSVNSDGTFSYTPRANYNGGDSFTVLVSDGHGGSTVATVAITVTPVNDAPTGSGLSVSGSEDSAITGQVNTSDIDGDTLTHAKGSDPLHGNVVVNSNGSFTYTPTSDFNGTDQFTVNATDGHGGATSVTVVVTVTPVNDRPVATAPGTPYAATEQVGLNLAGTGLAVSDVDAGGNTIQAILNVASGTLSASAGSTGVLVTGSGSSQITLSGTQAQINALLNGAQGATLNYVIDTDAPPATDTLTLTVNDQGHAGAGSALTSTPASALIQITAVDDTPVMTPTTVAATASPSMTWAPGALLSGASDPDGGTLTVRIVQGPQHGTVTVHPDGQVTYATDVGYVGQDSFSYEAYDGQGASTGVRTVALQASYPVAALPTQPTPSNSIDNDHQATPSSVPSPTQKDNTPPEAGSTQSPASTTTSGATQGLPPAATPGGGDNGDGTALHQRVQASPWQGNKGSSDPAFIRNLVFSPVIGGYGGTAFASGAGNATIIQLLEMIKPTLEHSSDINLMLTPLSSVTHAFPARASSDVQGPGEEAGSQPIRLARMATYSTGLGLSIGTIWWTARISGLVTSALISTPAWRSLDPLPVVTSPAEEDDPDGHDQDSHLGDREVEHLFDADRPIEQDLPIIQ